MKICISGKISGEEIEDVEYKFKSAEHFLLSNGVITVNPIKIRPLFDIKKYWFFMVADIWELLFRDAIFMLPDWNESKGAKIEHSIAKFLGLKIIYDN